MPFGIAVAPGTFQELMTKVLGNIRGAVVYLDDILVYSKSKTEHVQILEKVLKIESKSRKMSSFEETGKILGTYNR